MIDSTEQFLNDINITSGIRHGCNLLALLFLVVTYKIIDEINNINYGIQIDQNK